MNKNTLIAAVLMSACALAQASTIQVETAAVGSGVLGSATAYRDAVTAALATSSYATRSLTSYDNISHQALFGGNSNFALKSTINFGVQVAGAFDFRAGVDFGAGGAMFLDGVAVDLKSNDMWWAGSYGNSSQFFAATRNLAAGNHVLSIYGFENCCDGGQQVQFRGVGQNFTSFGANDGLNAVNVPEPGSVALLMAGVAMLGMTRRRKPAGK